MHLSAQTTTQDLRFARLRGVVDALANASVEDVAQVAVQAALDVLGAAGGVVYTLRTDGQLAFAGGVGVPESTRRQLAVMPLDTGRPVALAVKERRELWLEGYDTLVAQFPGVRQSNVPPDRLQAVIALPLLVGGRVVGGMGLSFASPQSFGPEAQVFVRTGASLCALAIERSALLQAEREARAQVERERADLYAMLVDAPACVALVEGPEHVYALSSRMNDAVAARDRLVGRRLRDALPELVEQGVEQIIDHVYQTGEPFRFSEVPTLLRRGDLVEEHFFNGIFQPTRNAQGQITGVANFAFDVTDQVRARQRAELSEAQFRALVDNLPELAWSARPDGYIDYFNPRFYEYTGTTFEEVAGRGWEKVHDPAMLPQVAARWQEALATGEPIEMEFPLRGADGVYRWFLTRVRPLRGPDGRILRWFGITTNTDEHRKQAAALQQAVALRDDFLSIAGHELRTPLAALLLHLQSLERATRKEGGPPRLLERLGKAGAAAGRLELLVNQLLDVSRLQAGRFVLDPHRTDLVTLVQEVIGRHTEHAAAGEIALAAPAELVGTWDHARLDQVVTNLLVNAIKYGRGNPVEVALAQRDGHAVLEVTDHGIGIPEEAHERIFQRFERAAGSSDHAGIGLGLWITREIVAASGGRIDVRSQPGQGSTFTVTLPLEPQVSA
jgi:PAS domain S-box-containing protein